MANTTISIRTESEVKAEAQEILADLGLDLSTAFNLFLRQIIKHGGIPFAVTTNAPRPRLGGWEGRISVPEDFDSPLPDFGEYTD